MTTHNNSTWPDEAAEWLPELHKPFRYRTTETDWFEFSECCYVGKDMLIAKDSLGSEYTIVHSTGNAVFAPAEPGEEKTKPEWDGEGLPSVGDKVRCTFAVEGHSEWHEGNCAYRGVNPEGIEFVVIQTQNYAASYRTNDHIRPLYAKSDWEETIEDMLFIVRKLPALDRDIPDFHQKNDLQSMLALYKAGYRRVEEKL